MNPKKKLSQYLEEGVSLLRSTPLGKRFGYLKNNCIFAGVV